MMDDMKIVVMRQAGAVAAATAGSDAERQLKPKARELAQRAGRILRSLQLDVGPVVTSPFVRAHETAMLVHSELAGAAAPIPVALLAPGSAVGELLRAAVNYGEPRRKWMLAVMHEPDVSTVLSQLLYGGEAYPFAVEPGDLFALRVTIDHGSTSARLVLSCSVARLGD